MVKKMHITGITADSREVKKGYAFVAINGNHQNGEEFIGDAIKNGAAKIVVSRESIIILPPRGLA